VSFPELALAAVVLIVVAANVINRGKRARRPPASGDTGLPAEAIDEQRGGEAAATDLRALLEAARSARETAKHVTITPHIEQASAPAELADILATARERKQTAAVTETRKSHKKKRRDEQTGERIDPVAQRNRARPPLGAHAPEPALPAMRAIAARAPMHPHSPISAP
jgi:hypothetical protein